MKACIYISILFFACNIPNKEVEDKVGDQNDRKKEKEFSKYYIAENVDTALAHINEVKVLSLIKDEHKTLPEALIYANLEILFFTNCYNLDVDAFFKNFKNAKTIKELYITNCSIESLTPDVCKFSTLKKFECHNENFRKIPACFGELNNLVSLELGYSIENLPNSFANLDSLKFLTLSGNKFKKFPLAICGLKNLEILNIDNNEISNIPDEILKLKTLKLIDVSNTPFAEKEIENLKNTSKSIFLEKCKAELPDCEVRLYPLPVGY